MSYQVLARKWRPKRFEEVVGQEHVTRSLQNSLRSGKLAHAYLFTGTRGVGKTSIARLFAKAVRCEARTTEMNPCLQCQSCKDIEQGNSLDYIEIDGASNNSVDNIRELIENVRYLPARGTHKIYVIDEVHMLSTAAFNALLKTLEEPPAHAIFVFATTDAHKLLGTVLSRCQRFDFKNVSVEALTQHIQMVASKEGIVFQDKSLERKLAEYGKGSVRDTLSLFDQVLSLAGGKTIDDAAFYQSLGLARSGAIKELFGHILNQKPIEASKLFQDFLRENIDLKRLIDQLLEAFYEVIQRIDQPQEAYKQNLIPVDSLKGITYAELFWIFETFTKDCIWALTSPSPEKVVDLVLQKICRRRQILKPDQSIIRHEAKSTDEITKKSIENKMIPPQTIEELVSFMDGAPTVKANLELGDFFENPILTNDELTLSFAFPHTNAMASEYLQDSDVLSKLKDILSTRYKLDKNKIFLKFKTLTEDEARNKNFTSMHQREVLKRTLDVENKKDKILNDPFIREAERLFNSKVDKVILKDQ